MNEQSRQVERAEEDAAALLVLLAVLRAPGATGPAEPRSAWPDHAHRLRVVPAVRSGGPAGGAGWWASGLPS